MTGVGSLLFVQRSNCQCRFLRIAGHGVISFHDVPVVLLQLFLAQLPVLLSDVLGYAAVFAADNLAIGERGT